MNQSVAEERLAAFGAEFQETLAAWRNGLQAGGKGSGSGEAATQDVLRRWREYMELLRAQSDAAVANQGVMDRLATAVDQLTEQRSVLAELQSEAGSRSAAATMVNPKVRASPYTNILGLDRTFRESTRRGIIIATVVFAVLALAAIGFWVWRIVSTGTVVQVSYQLGGAVADYTVKTGGRR
jgi:hypothetical protein